MPDLLVGAWVALLPSALNRPVGVIGDLDTRIAVGRPEGDDVGARRGVLLDDIRQVLMEDPSLLLGSERRAGHEQPMPMVQHLACEILEVQAPCLRVERERRLGGVFALSMIVASTRSRSAGWVAMLVMISLRTCGGSYVA